MLVLFVAVRRVMLLELAAAAAIVGGVSAQWGSASGWIAGGVFGLVKAFELDLSTPDPDGDG